MEMNRNGKVGNSERREEKYSRNVNIYRDKGRALQLHRNILCFLFFIIASLAIWKSIGIKSDMYA